MAIVLSSIAPALVFEWREAYDAVLKGKIALDKVKVPILNAFSKTDIHYTFTIYILCIQIAISTAPRTPLPSTAQHEEEYAISISGGKFQWSTDHIVQSSVDSNFILNIEQLNIPKVSFIIHQIKIKL